VNGKTLREIGNKFRLTRERIRQIEETLCARSTLVCAEHNRKNRVFDEVLGDYHQKSPQRWVELRFYDDYRWQRPINLGCGGRAQ
jgi:Sigma-70, region 4